MGQSQSNDVRQRRPRGHSDTFSDGMRSHRHSSSERSEEEEEMRVTSNASPRRGLGAFRALSARNFDRQRPEDDERRRSRLLRAGRAMSARALGRTSAAAADLERPRPTMEELPSLISMDEPELESADLLAQSPMQTTSEPRITPSGSEELNALSEENPSTPTSLSNLLQPASVPPELQFRFDTHSPSTPQNLSIDEAHHHVTFDNNSPGQGRAVLYYRRSSACSTESGESTVSDIMIDDDEFNDDFYPLVSSNNEWMGRSIESLLLGHAAARAPILALTEDDGIENHDIDLFNSSMRRRSTASTFGGGPIYSRRRSSQGSFPGGRRSSLSLAGSNMHGGTLANYYNRRRQLPTDVDRSYEQHGRRASVTNVPMYRRRSSVASGAANESNYESAASGGNKAGPNVLFSVMARESTGKSCFPRGIPASQCLLKIGGNSLFGALDKPAAGIASEVAFLAAAIDSGDWTETQTIVSRLSPRLIGDPMAAAQAAEDGASSRHSIDDPTLPPTASRFYAGGGRLGLERDAFVQAGGVEVLIRMFREKSFVGEEMAGSYDARDLSEEIVATRLAPCWNEALASLRELVYAIPSLVENRTISDNGDFLPFLFTLLSHDSCFDGAASLIEEILSLLSQTPQQPSAEEGEAVPDGPSYQPVGRVAPATTFFLGNVPNLYELWSGFNCRQLAHFCRILALLVFEPEDRQLLESPAVLKSLELLQLRRNRAVRAGRDSTVDMNQAILLGDEELLKRLLKLLRVMNYAPSLRRFASYHVMAHFPFIADTLIMIGLAELDTWSEIDRQEALARKLLEEETNATPDEESLEMEEPLLSELGAVVDMLESLSTTLVGNPREVTNQLGHILHVIAAAQQAGVIVGRSPTRRRRNRDDTQNGSQPANDGTPDSESVPEVAGASISMGGVPIDGATIQGLASVAGILTDQVLLRRLNRNTGQEVEESPDSGPVQVVGLGLGGISGSPAEGHDRRGMPHHLINNPEDAANSLQFNAMLLGPYQVEVLFVLCTLLGGRRKLDAQDKLNRLGMVPVLDDMFQRLPWYRRESQTDDSEEADSPGSDQQPNGIHGPGCECTPESALCVQYLRLLHNFCDRDCDNYDGRRLLLSESERQLIFGDGNLQQAKPGLLSKIISAFIRESDESPYRFWLASCIESYLRGSTPGEQMFAARSGLLCHLVEDISSERLHCAGSLQTSFDLLGELGKGNSEVVRLLVTDLDEESFRKLMSVAAANLVDSNVFIRSLLLSLERLSAANRSIPLYLDPGLTGVNEFRWATVEDGVMRSYLTHSWWDTRPISLGAGDAKVSRISEDNVEPRQSDWFPTREMTVADSTRFSQSVGLPTGLQESVGHFGWVFTPDGDTLSSNTFLPNTVERLSWFLAANQARLLRDLLGVVDLRNINHENICCLNTAVVIAIFAHRRQQLSALLDELREMNNEENESKRRAIAAGEHDDVVDRAFVQAMRYLDLENRRETPSYARIASIATSNMQQIGDRTDVMRNFREVLWFWKEYYTHRGRDRLSLEFSSHLRFQEWNYVVSLLTADDNSSTSLVSSPVRLPRSPYQRAARIADNPLRGT